METHNKTTAAPASGAAPRPAVPASTPPQSDRLTRADRDRLFNTAAASMTPERARNTENLAEQWWPQIRRKHREGYSLSQILTMCQTPGIDLKLSRRSLQRMIKAHERAKRPTTPAQA